MNHAFDEQCVRLDCWFGAHTAGNDVTVGPVRSFFPGEFAAFEHMPDQAVVFGELMRLAVTQEIDARVAGMRNHRCFPKCQEQGNGRAHPFLRWIALPHGIDLGTGFLHRPCYQTQHLGALLERWRGDIVAQDSTLTADARLDEAYRSLTRDFSGSMATHAITDDIEPELLVDKAGILIMVTLTTNVRLSRGSNAHVRLTW